MPIKITELTIQCLSRWGFSKNGICTNRRGEWWLFGQISLILAHLLPAYPTSKLITENVYIKTSGSILIFLGFFLCLNAFISLGKNLSPLPDPMLNSKLVKTNAYKTCRHPIYRAIIIFSLGVSLYLASLLHIALLISLCLILKGKALREEKFLSLKYSSYNTYMSNTPAIIPWLPFLDWH